MSGVLFGVDGLPASMAAAVISTAGVMSVALFGRAAAERNSANIAAFAVGLLTVAVFFHLIPEALDISLVGIGWVFGGFGAMVLIGIAIQASISKGDDVAALTFGYASIIALSVHSFLDGVIYAAAFQGEQLDGWISVSGLMLHEFPEGVIAFFLLAQAGLSTFRSIALAFCAASLTTVSGTLIADAAISMTTQPSILAMLGCAAGALIYVLIVHLAPHAMRAKGPNGVRFAQFGVIVGVAAVILNSLGGGH